MTAERPNRPTDSYAAYPDRTERILFFLTVGVFVICALIVILFLLL